MTIWKCKLRPDQQQSIQLPKGAQIISTAAQGDTICVWATVPGVPLDSMPVDRPLTSQEATIHTEYHTIEVFGTGHSMPEPANRRFIGTVLIGQYMWHVFERMDEGR